MYEQIHMLLPANGTLAWVVCADAVVVAVVKMADRRAAIVGSVRLGHTIMTRRTLQYPLTHICL